jgi:hypothetical protein
VTESFNLGADSRIETEFRLPSLPEAYCGPFQSLPAHIKALVENPLEVNGQGVGGGRRG